MNIAQKRILAVGVPALILFIGFAAASQPVFLCYDYTGTIPCVYGSDLDDFSFTWWVWLSWVCLTIAFEFWLFRDKEHAKK